MGRSGWVEEEGREEDGDERGGGDKEEEEEEEEEDQNAEESLLFPFPFTCEYESSSNASTSRMYLVHSV